MPACILSRKKLRELEQVERFGLFDTINGIYTCNTVNEVNLYIITFATGKEIWGIAGSYILKGPARTLASRRVWPGQIAYCK